MYPSPSLQELTTYFFLRGWNYSRNTKNKQSFTLIDHSYLYTPIIYSSFGDSHLYLFNIFFLLLFPIQNQKNASWIPREGVFPFTKNQISSYYQSWSYFLLDSTKILKLIMRDFTLPNYLMTIDEEDCDKPYVLKRDFA